MDFALIRELAIEGGDAVVAVKELNPLETALAEFRAARGLEPGSAERMMNLGIAYLNLSQLDDAVAALREAIRLRPSLAEAHRNLGRALDKLGCTDEAITEFRAATRISPGDSAAQKNLGDAVARQSEFERAPAEQKGLLDAGPSAGKIEPAPAGYIEAAGLHAAPPPARIDLKEAFAESAFESAKEKQVELLLKKDSPVPAPPSTSEP